MHKNNAASGKLEYLDGIRGFMAFNVIVNHFVCIYYPQMYFPEFAESTGGFLSLFATTPCLLCSTVTSPCSISLC